MTTLALTIVRGKSASFDIAVTTNAANGASVPADLTGASVEFTAKDSIANTANYFQKTAGNGITVLNAATGLLRLNLTPADTFTSDFRDSLYCDLQVYFPSGAAVYTAAAGFLSFSNNAPVNFANS